MIRFPSNNNSTSDKSAICIDSTFYAKHNTVTHSSGKQIGFLTEHTLFFILKGQKKFHLEHRMVSINSNQVILVKRGIYTVSEQLSEDGIFEALMIFLPEKMLAKIVREQPSQNGKDISPFLVIDKNELINDFQYQYLKYFKANLRQPEELLNLKVREIILLLSSTEKADDVLFFFHSCINKSAIDIEFVIKQHLFQQFDIRDFAKLTCRSVATFKRDFQKLFNTPPKTWINKQRLQHAKSLLSMTEKSTSEISLECGFDSVSHFIKIFKSEYGDTPHAFRAKVAIS